MRVNNKQHAPIHLHKENIKEIDKFTYVGSVISKGMGMDEDIKSHINKTRHVFRTLRPIWWSSAISNHKKIRIFNSNMKSFLFYSCETWHTINRYLHNIRW
jgi:hypothetical protein